MFKRLLALLFLGAVIAVMIAASVTLAPLTRARAEIDSARAQALLPAQVREAEAAADIAEEQARIHAEGAAFWRAFWGDALRHVRGVTVITLYGVMALALAALAAPVAYVWLLTLARAPMIWPDARGNLPIAPGNPILLDAEKALTLATNAQIAAAIVGAMRAQGDAATAQSIGQSVSQALVSLTDTLGARQARAIATPDRRWIHPRAAPEIAEDDGKDWASDMIQFIRRGAVAGFGRREWAGTTLPSGRACTPVIWAAMRDDLLTARVARQDGRGQVTLAVEVPEALVRLELA